MRDKLHFFYRYQYYLLAATVIFFFLIILDYYFSGSVSDKVFFGSAGLEKFGGWIDGLLNPLLGCIIIFLLLRSLSIQQDELKHHDSIRNVESLKKLIEEMEADFSGKLNENFFVGKNEKKFSFISCYKNSAAAESYERKKLESIVSCVQSNKLVQRIKADLEYNFVQELIAQSSLIIRHKVKLVDIEQAPHARTYSHSKLLDFFMQSKTMGLVPEVAALSYSPWYRNSCEEQIERMKEKMQMSLD
ncbi:MAG: hypothetical protein V4732_21950 [Pseudomonadota bacterium]